jgi:hypothetical protein
MGWVGPWVDPTRPGSGAGRVRVAGFFDPSGLVHWVAHGGSGRPSAIVGYPWVGYGSP